MNDSATKSNSSFDAGGMQVGATLLSASTITGDEVCNMQDEKLGKIQDVMLDTTEGKIRYAVLASGGFLGMGDRLFAVPWKALKHDKENRRFMLDVDVERLKNAPGFDKDQWPNMADATWSSTVESYYTR
ncbi:PRC-barrel domain-containing protein [Halomonas heilongjiangensis]|uniref:Photosystem reaction center subunit H n=1 Tax=Halomonas heilongjiangensis TaxID=1387883 RepID=A0A2N7TPH3_9GAMM|nr:PRC-barrel domain-containing protein [Halomonas heilongjiangensis]PMR70093.1 photosystem reaction center subunit H [Halomonas heilongjiangensis]PXX94457.1 photosystem reaction center subunit H [Halomonas heilongjiangensis]